SSTKTESLLCK
ncbi:hypothetical protein D049_2162B, partial [Vibrio parahaemolyticus VPTS-2010]